MAKKASAARKTSDDDEPLELRRRSLQPEAMRSAPTAAAAPPRTSSAKKPKVDWFDFFLSAGCDVDDCTRYASSFERDKIDESILADITESTMRSLGLREGDIIRVKKTIDQKYTKKANGNGSASDVATEQMRKDEELAKQLQAEEEGGGSRRGQAPNMFTNADGTLKASVRRGRPQPSKSLLPGTVDLQAISTVSDQIQRSSSPMIPRADSPANAAASARSTQSTPARPSSAAPVPSGFDNDAWTIRPSSTRPSSTKPLAPTPPAPTPPAVAPRVPSAPPAPPPPPAPPVAPPAPIAPAVSQPAVPAQPPLPQPERAQSAGASPAIKSDNDIFEQLARLSSLRSQNTGISQYPPRAASVATTPVGFTSGMGMGNSPYPMGQVLQAQQTGLLPSSQASQFNNGPRGPFAPVPANQALLQPLVPTTTGFNSFVPTRPQSANPSFISTQPTGFQGSTPSLGPQPTGFQPNPSLGPQPTGFQPSLGPQPTGFQSSPSLGPQPTGFQGLSSSLAPQMTGFPGSSHLGPQPTGFGGGPFGNQSGGFSGLPSFQSSSPFGQAGPTNSFSSGPIQPRMSLYAVVCLHLLIFWLLDPTGFNSGYGQSPYGSGITSPPPAPAPPPAQNTSPANIFAQMKSGTFANESAPQNAGSYFLVLRALLFTHFLSN